MLRRYLILLMFFAAAAAPSSWAGVKILALGDSLTDGLGVTRDEAWPAVLAELLHESGHPDAQVINAGVSGATSASDLGRLKWQLKAHPDILILAMGANDGLRGKPVDELRKNLADTIELARKNGMRVLLCGMKLPENMGADYLRRFQAVYADLAKRYKTAYMPFLLEGVGGDPALNQPDRLHPTAQGHRIVAKNVLKYLKPML